MFIGNPVGSREKEITLHEIGEEALELLIDFVYTGKLDVDLASLQAALQALLTVASFLQMERCDVLTNEWSSLPSTGKTKNCCGLAIMCNALYASSVHDAEDHDHGLLEFEKLDFSSGTWSIEEIFSINGVPLNSVYRNEVGTGVLDGVLYILGGQNGKDQDVALAQRYNLSTKQLQTLAPLLHVKVPLKLEYLKDLFIPIVQKQKEVERYDPRLQESGRQLSRCKLNVCSCTALNGHLYAIGGSNLNGKAINTCERFNPDSELWSTIASLRQPRIQPGLLVHEVSLYAVGGGDSNGGAIGATGR